MICSKCKNNFDEGIFCPNCGTRYKEKEERIIEENVSLESNMIVDEFVKAQEERDAILKLGWPEFDEIQKQIDSRLIILSKAQQLNSITPGARELIEKMKADIRNDYYKLEERGSGVGQSLFVAIAVTILSLFLLSLGIIGFVIGIVLMIIFWPEYSKVRKANKRAKQLKMFMQDF